MVAAVGEEVADFSEGDLIAWSASPESHAELVRVKAERPLRVPEGVDLNVAAALPLQGITATTL